ncbi:helix-turn-helix domain-containing protein [Morganella morganii]|uniref:helix-turn-helix domain-containing protein n=1 Tax=Morganella morganii TaxID=582 RepID=UPI0034D51552
MKVTSLTALANSVRDQQKISKMSQTQTAELIGIKQITVSDFENKPESTKLGTLFKILAVLDLHVAKRDSAQDEKKTWNKVRCSATRSKDLRLSALQTLSCPAHIYHFSRLAGELSGISADS